MTPEDTLNAFNVVLVINNTSELHVFFYQGRNVAVSTYVNKDEFSNKNAMQLLNYLKVNYMRHLTLLRFFGNDATPLEKVITKS